MARAEPSAVDREVFEGRRVLLHMSIKLFMLPGLWLTAAVIAVLLSLVLPLAATHSSHGDTAFTWLRPQVAPQGWNVATMRSGAALAYPQAWREIETDPGTVSAAPPGPRGSFVGYLNATPVGGSETLANWRRFRVAHVAAEGAHDVRLTASATGLHFLSGRGSCVVDSYSTTKRRFREIACIVAGAHATTVVVAAAPAAHWAQHAKVLELAVASFTT
jgi:hypothetical protein